MKFEQMFEHTFEREGRGVNASMCGMSPERYDLISGGSDLVDLSLLAARTAAVLRSVSHGSTITIEDDETLRGMARVLSDAAHAVQFFDGKTATPPSATLVPRIDAAIDALLDEPRQPADAAAISHRLEELSDRLCSQEEWAVGEASRLSSYFSNLSRSVLNQMGHVGEIAAAL